MCQPPQQTVAACALITNARGDVLLVKTSYRSGWEIPGGAVERGEDALQGAIRETHEEAGVDVRITHLAGIYTNLTRGVLVFA